jgi:hypothetical protein
LILQQRLKLHQQQYKYHFADIALFRFEVQNIIKMPSLILQPEHTDEGLTIQAVAGGVGRGGGGYSHSMRLIKMSYFCCHLKKYLLDWATS